MKKAVMIMMIIASIGTVNLSTVEKFYDDPRITFNEDGDLHVEGLDTYLEYEYEIWNYVNEE